MRRRRIRKAANEIKSTNPFRRLEMLSGPDVLINGCSLYSRETSNESIDDRKLMVKEKLGGKRENIEIRFENVI